jgi:glutamate--cysteine ligase
MTTIARNGLKRRARENAHKQDERIYLTPLEQILEDGKTLAERRLDDFNGAWGKAIERSFKECVLDF